MICNFMTMIGTRVLFRRCWLMNKVVVLIWVFEINMWWKSQTDCGFGAPYGTSLWQVVDLTEQNGTYKIHFFKANNEIPTHRIGHKIGDMELLPTDIIPLINKDWINSFSEVWSNKKIYCKTWLVSIQPKSSYAQSPSCYYENKRYWNREKRVILPSNFLDSKSSIESIHYNDLFPLFKKWPPPNYTIKVNIHLSINL